MAKGSEWVDYGMLLDEIRLHRSNAQRQINEYREKGKERDLTKSEYGLYNEEIGKKIALMCLERWCMDFKFSISEIKEMEDNMIQAEKKLPEGLEEAAKKYAEKHGFRVPYDGSNNFYDDVDVKASKENFIAGAKYAAPRWISVDEKLPEMDEEVIVLTDELGTAPIYKIAFGHIVDVERCIDYNGWNIPGVKYWMPCPEIPNND